MIRCKLINFLFRVFPVRAFQGFLIKNHSEKCSYCQSSLAKREETRLFIPNEEKASELVNLWPGINKTLCEGSPKKNRISFLPRWRWALSAAVLTMFILSGVLYLNRTNSTELALQQDLDQSFKINYIKIEEKPAAPYVYEPNDSEIIHVWAEILP